MACTSSDGNGRPSTTVGSPSTGLPGTGGGGAPALGNLGNGTGATGAVPTGVPGTGGMGAPTSSTGGMAAPMSSTGGMAAPMAGTGGSGAAGTGSAGASAPMGGSGAAADCPAAPAGASDAAIAALAAVNAVRVPAGSGCDNMVLTLNMSALNHCNYYAANSSNQMCVADPHGEVSGCTGFTGANVGDRMMAAGYNAFGGYSEVMAFVDNPDSAVATWVNSVWHRIPILDPWTTDLGYGNDTSCDTIDFGTGTMGAPANTVVVYPYDGQTGVPTSFDGSREGPMPPAPSSGWPSSSPINIYAQKLSITEHTLTVDGDSTPIEHVWLDTASSTDPNTRGFLRNTAFMYANTPFMANTTYRVTMTGTGSGGPINLTWTFTTGAANPFGR